MQAIAKEWRETLAVAARLLRELRRRRRSLIFWAIFPAITLVLQGLLLEERVPLLSRAAAFERAAPATLVGAALFFSCMGGSVAAIVAEREQKTLKRLFISPLGGTAYFLGIFLAHGAIACGQSVLTYALAAAFGARVQGTLWAGFLVILLTVAAYVGVGFIFGTQLARRTEDANAAIATLGVPLLMLGGAFVPVNLFPESLQGLARYNPVHHAIQSLLGVWARGWPLAEVGGHITFLSIFAMTMVGLGWLAYRRMVRVEQCL
ncbi:MAG: ABC transporter permease [Cyanobacteria bacterium J06641_5]